MTKNLISALRFCLTGGFLLSGGMMLAAEGITLGDGKLPSLNWGETLGLARRQDRRRAQGGRRRQRPTTPEALQAAFDKVVSGVTIYMPPGAYRITKTLDLNRKCPKGAFAVTIIGHGRDTVPGLGRRHQWGTMVRGHTA